MNAEVLGFLDKREVLDFTGIEDDKRLLLARDLKKFGHLLNTIQDQNKMKAYSTTLEFESDISARFIENLIAKLVLHKTFICEMTLTYLMAAFESFLKEYFTVLLSQNSVLIKSSKKQIAYEELVAFTTMEEIKEHIASKEIDKVIAEGIDDFQRFCKEKFSLEMHDEIPCWGDLREAWFRRNVVVHNRSETDEKYCLKTKMPRLGVKLNTDGEYIEKLSIVLRESALLLNKTLCEKLNLVDKV